MFSSSFCSTETSSDDISDIQLYQKQNNINFKNQNLNQNVASPDFLKDNCYMEGIIKNISIKNQKLYKKNSHFSMENEDLKERLYILSKSYSELQLKMKILQDENMKITKLNRHINTIRRQNEKINKEKKKLQSCFDQAQKQIQTILRSASNLFKIKFANPKCLIDYLNMILTESQTPLQIFNVEEPEADELSKKIQNLKKINENLNNNLLASQERLIQEQIKNKYQNDYITKTPDSSFELSNSNSDLFSNNHDDSYIKNENITLALKELELEMKTQAFTLEELKKERDKMLDIAHKQDELLKYYEFKFGKKAKKR